MQIELAIGPMFSGKSSWLIKKLTAHKKNKESILAIKYKEDKRYSASHIASHNGTEFLAKSAKNLKDIENLIQQAGKINVFGIDEIQFFEKELASVLRRLKEKNIQVFAAGLDLDFLGNPWQTTSEVIAIADTAENLLATCSVCNLQIATKTQRLINGKPAPKNSPRIMIGDTDVYSPRCALHYEKVE